MQVSFTVVGEPKGKQRPRVVHTGCGVKTYTPQQTVVYENLVKYSYMEQVGRQKLEAPIEAKIVGIFPIPQRTSKRRRLQMLAARVFHTKKIDCDNLAKIILDSLNKVAFDDDAGVSRLVVEKIYGEQPRVEITLAELPEQEVSGHEESPD